jgi:phage repressor protein C with HTH and peptisase S24 domain
MEKTDRNIIDAEAFSKRFHEALDARGYPPMGHGRITYIIEVFELSRAGVNKWVHGLAVPHFSSRKKIAEKLGVNLAWLERGVGSMEDKIEGAFSPSKLAHEIPLMTLKDAYDYHKRRVEDFEKLVVNNTIPSTAIAVQNAGSAMEPKFSKDILLIIDTGIKQFLDGDFVLAKTKRMPEAIIRQFIMGSESNYLVAINDKFDPVAINTSVEIIGKVIEARSAF